MSDETKSKTRKLKLKVADVAAMYRCAFYSAMGVAKDEMLPSDEQCLQWFQQVIAQARHTTYPTITLVERQPQIGYAAGYRPVEILQWDAFIFLPEWRAKQ